jgi:hypothetical protein
MRAFQLEIDEKFFNLVWRSICCREAQLLAQIEREGEDSDEAALIANEVVYLRMWKKELEGRANSEDFSPGAFSLSDGFMDLSDL